MDIDVKIGNDEDEDDVHYSTTDDEDDVLTDDYNDEQDKPVLDLCSPDLIWTVHGYAKDEVVLAFLTALLKCQSHKSNLKACFSWALELLSSGFTSLFPLLKHIYYDFYYELNPTFEAYLDRKEKEGGAPNHIYNTLTVIKNMARMIPSSNVFLWRQLTYNDAILLDYDLNRLSVANDTADNPCQLFLTHVMNHDWFSMCYELRWLFERDLGEVAQLALWHYYADKPQRKTVTPAVLQQHHTFIQILLLVARCEADLSSNKVLRFITLTAEEQDEQKMLDVLPGLPEIIAAFELSQQAVADANADNHLLVINQDVTWQTWVAEMFPLTDVNSILLEEKFKFRF